MLIFSFIILFHEFGHFLLAKLNHVTVVAFSLGMGPTLFHVTAGETDYCLKLLPFGGSCMMLGEDGDDLGEGTFGSKSVWARISIVAAGPVFNLILAYLMAVILIGSVGYDLPLVVGVSEGYPAEAAGILPGDLITSINGKPIHLYREISNYNLFHQNEYMEQRPVEITVKREDGTKTVSLVPRDDGRGKYILGIQGSGNYRFLGSPMKVLQYSAYEVKYWIDTTIDSLKMIFRGQVTMDDVSGPVGVVDMIGDTYEESKTDGAYYVWLNLLNISILLTANLGIMNLLPLPALDGGRLMFMFIELIRGKRVDAQLEGRIHLTGLTMLLIFMIVIMVNDVKKIFIP